MKLGDLVRDTATGEAVLITSINPVWIDTDGQKHQWDFEVLGDGNKYFIDKDELEVLKKGGH